MKSFLQTIVKHKYKELAQRQQQLPLIELEKFDNLLLIRNSVYLPLLCKEFILSHYQKILSTKKITKDQLTTNN
jgi:hypothetical protein